MATVTKGRTFVSGETVTPAKLNDLVDQATVSAIVNADVDASAAIALSKLATGALPTAITVASANLVDGTIVNADISATANISGSKLADGAVVQVVQAADAARQTTTAVIPTDDTTPTNTEGAQILSQSITPSSATNKVLIRAAIPFTSSGNTTTFALFRGSTCIAATIVAPTNTFYFQNAVIEYMDSPASTSSQTYTIRAGANAAATVAVSGNESSATNYFGGKLFRTMTLMEIKAS